MDRGFLRHSVHLVLIKVSTCYYLVMTRIDLLEQHHAPILTKVKFLPKRCIDAKIELQRCNTYIYIHIHKNKFWLRIQFR